MAPIIPWLLIGVYGDASHRQNPEIWQRIKDIAGWGMPLVCMGDTWTNRPNASSAVHVRLDRAVADTAWCNMFPDAYVNHLHRVHSDHCPILLRTKREVRGPRRFRIENWWLQTKEFKNQWVIAWKREEQAGWEQKYSRMREAIRNWEKTVLTPQRKPNECTQRLLTIQSVHPMHMDFSLEERILKEYEAERDLNDFWSQRARVQWGEDGDRNTAFFHAMTTQRRRINKVVSIQDSQGMLHTDEKRIRRVFVSYFKELYTSQLGPEANERIMEYIESVQPKLGQQFSRQMAAQLEVVPSPREIHEALSQMGPDKSPGPDGLTARFIQDNWAEMGPDNCKFIERAFWEKEAPREWAACQIVLISKGPRTYNPKGISSY